MSRRHFYYFHRPHTSDHSNLFLSIFEPMPLSVFSKSPERNPTQLNCRTPKSHKSLLGLQHCVRHLEVSDRFVNKTTIKRKPSIIFSRRRTFFFICAQTATTYTRQTKWIHLFSCSLLLLLRRVDGMEIGPHNSFSFSFASIDFAWLLRETHERASTCARPIFSCLLSFSFLSGDHVSTTVRQSASFEYANRRRLVFITN